MIKTIDLFAGAGGLSYGFLMTEKYKLVAAAEINKNAQETYKKNIVKGDDEFELIDNVIGYDFEQLNMRYEGGIDVVIGGPPCQGFSNANRQKNNLISMNNSLVKDFFRAIRQIRPKAFVMENVSMLSSSTHRFYESTRDNEEIDRLIEQGYSIPKEEDILVLSKDAYENIDMQQLPEMDLYEFALSKELAHLLSVLRKNVGNDNRMPNFLKKNSASIIKLTKEYIADHQGTESAFQKGMSHKLKAIEDCVKDGAPEMVVNELSYIVGVQKLIQHIKEIQNNGLIGRYVYSEKEGLRFVVNSYSVIDYVNAILGNMYIQTGKTVNAEWFGVPQERRRYIVIGIRKDIYEKAGTDLVMPEEPDNLKLFTVKDAIDDLANYEVGYKPQYQPVPYRNDEGLSEYAKVMRKGSTSVKNHITTKTTQKALDRFKKIPQGKNFHSLGVEDKDTYTNPERTQNTIYLRLDPTKPCGTVVNVRKSMWIHPHLDRAVTVREAARLQSFPDSFEFLGSKDSQYQQVGNAVPPLLAKGIAEIILKYVE